MTHKKLWIILLSLLLIAVAAVLVTSSVAPSLATVPSFMNQENSISGQSAESRKLDETALRKNALERLKKAIKDQEPDAKGLERLTIENMIVQKSIPIKAGDLDLYLVKVQFKNPEAESEDNYGNVELVMLVDHTQFKAIGSEAITQQYIVDTKGVWR